MKGKVCLRSALFVLLALLLFPASAPLGAPTEGGWGAVLEAAWRATRGTIKLDGSSVRASRRGSRIVAHFPLKVSGAGGATVDWRIALFDLSGKRLSHRRGTTTVAAGGSGLDLSLKVKELGDAPADEARFVLSYRLETESQVFRGKRSLFHLLPRPALFVRTPGHLFADSPSRLPVVITDALTGAPYPDSLVQVVATDARGHTKTAEALTDASGAAVVALGRLPRGRVTLAATGRVAGAAPPSMESAIDVIEATRLHLSLDKPLYQPGQTMHLRSLVLRRPDNEPAANEEVLFEISDAKGNKVFKQVERTNEFGVAATRFTLATQVNKGRYAILVTAGDTQAERSVTVDRYTLPKFKVDLELDRPFYRPAQTLAGSVQARYFFGKAAADAAVKVTFFDYQGQWVVDREIEGKANGDGLFPFRYELPERLVGQPLENGDALLLVQVEVTDTAGQVQTANRQVTVASSALQLQLFPESGAIVPGVSNHFFLAVSDPAGTPSPGECEITFESDKGGKRTTRVGVDDSGLVRVEYAPPVGSTTVAAEVSMTADSGAAESSHFQFEASQGTASLLLRTDRTLARGGDEVLVEVLSVGGVSDAYLDVIRDNQTLLTTTIRLEEGKGSHRLHLSPEMAGTVALSAYVLSERGEFARDSRVLFVQEAGELKVEARLDKESYRPGDQARVDFQVTGPDGPRTAALGIHVVDEAVFALSEANPGLLRLFFALEEELLKPSYQVGRGIGLTLGGLIERHADAEAAAPGRLQDQAEAAIAAQGDVAVQQDAHTTFARQREEVRAILDEHAGTLRTRLVEAMQKSGSCGPNGELGKPGQVVESFRRDAWGRSYRKEADGQMVSIQSAGPDRAFDTWDDVAAQASAWEACPHRYYHGTRGGWAEEAIPTAAMDMDFAADMGGGLKGEPRMAEKMAKTDGPTKKPAETRSTSDKKGGKESVRVRKWFPETLFVENCLVTDDQGRATLDIPLADSITTWRMSTVASDAHGRIGGGTKGLRVFQDFFVDIDFPVFLTRNDRLHFPVVVYNYLESAQEVRLEVQAGDWFELLGDEVATVRLEPGQVASLRFPVRVTGVGWHALTVFARGSAGFSDAVQRKVEVRPDGKRVEASFSGRLKDEGDGGGGTTIEWTQPRNRIPGSSSLVVQILPGLTAHVVQGMDSLLRLPGGCFEQTTSSAWPNVLALKYIKDTEQSTPEIEMKAMQYVSAGYQRILTFECQSGGFNWWQGDNPGNVVLTALGIMQLQDASRVYPAVDRKVIERAFGYLKTKQLPDGSWGQDTHLHAGNENLGAGQLRTTCYVAWALQEGGFGDSAQSRKALEFVEKKLPQEKDLYTVGMCANALARADRRGTALDGAIARIVAAAITEGDNTFWKTEGQTLVNSGGIAGQVEVSALMALALIHSGSHTNLVPSVVNWLASTKDPQGNWGYNTQATVLALKVFLAAATLDPADTDADLVVRLNGSEVGRRHFDNFNKEVVWQLEAANAELDEANRLELVFEGSGNLGYQVVATHHVPSKEDPRPREEPLAIDVAYDRTKIRTDDLLKVTATFLRNAADAEGAVLATLGIPPGFDLQTEDLDRWKEKRVIRNYEVTGRQLILYLDSLPIGKKVSLDYRMRARYPVKAQTGDSEVRLYYQGETRATVPSRVVEAE